MYKTKILNATFVIILLFALLGFFTFIFGIVDLIFEPSVKETKTVEILKDVKEINLNGIIYIYIDKLKNKRIKNGCLC